MIMSSQFRPAVLSALTVAVLAILGSGFAPNRAHAAGLEGGQEASRAAQASERARKRREERAAANNSGDSSGDGASKYPNATRKEPPAKATGKNNRQLNQLQKDLADEKYQDVIDGAQNLPDSFNAYEKAYVYTLAADAATKLERNDLAADFFSRVVQSDGMNNDGHFQAMLNLAIVQNLLDKKTEALATIDRFLKESKSEDRDHLNFRAQMLIELDRTAEAAAMYDDLVARFPDDKNIMTNAIALNSQAGKDDRVLALLKQARDRNMLTEPAEYRSMYFPLIQAGRFTEASELIEEGLAKGILKRDERLAADYQAMAETAFFDKNDVNAAITYYTRADDLSAKGEMALNLAKVLFNEGRMADARKAAQRALDKGVAKPEEARRIVNAK